MRSLLWHLYEIVFAQTAPHAMLSRPLPFFCISRVRCLFPRISKKKFLHSFSTVQEQSVNHWQGNESSGLMLSSKLKAG